MFGGRVVRDEVDEQLLGVPVEERTQVCEAPDRQPRGARARHSFVPVSTGLTGDNVKLGKGKLLRSARALLGAGEHPVRGTTVSERPRGQPSSPRARRWHEPKHSEVSGDVHMELVDFEAGGVERGGDDEGGERDE